jgi:hypothetical protein
MESIYQKFILKTLQRKKLEMSFFIKMETLGMIVYFRYE